MIEPMEGRLMLAGTDPIISEFMADNSKTLADQYGDYSDWIEIHNPGTQAVDLGGWSLTDNPADLRKWQFPSVTLNPGAYMVVFASQRDITSGSILHTNFKLDADGEHVALVKPDGTVTCSYTFAAQQPNMSYGRAQGTLTTTTLVASGAPATAKVPTSTDFPTGFAAVNFDDSGWMSGTTGVGYEKQSGYEGLIGLDVSAMYNATGVALIRIPFNATDPASYSALKLRMKYDDGFVAYLNGTEVASRNRQVGALTWDSAASALHDDSQALVYEDIDISNSRNALVNGKNVLAIVGLNRPASSSDFLILPELLGSKVDAASADDGFLTTPTPGRPNLSEVLNLGPLIDNVAHTPDMPGDTQDIQVTAKVMPWPQAVSGVNLTYRVQFGAEVTVPMYDDGKHGDGIAGDHVYGASIPASASTPGQMVRYYITASDSANRTSRAPLFASQNNSPQYFGTVVGEGLASTLPILYWFVQDTAGAEGSGARASLYYDCDGTGPVSGEFYDNIFVRHRGAFSTDGTKFDFNPGYHFKVLPDEGRVEEFNINYKGSLDDAYIRPVIGFETFRDAGLPASRAFPIHVEQNGNFYGVGIYIEQVDDDYLTRFGYDGEGSLYKMTQDRPQMQYASEFEKKNSDSSDNSDLQAFLDGIHQPRPAKDQYLFDHVDIPSFLNYQVGIVLTNDNDAAQKNYYLYHNPQTDRWMILPWDKDLTFGKHYGLADYQAGDPQTHPFFADSEHPKVDGSHAWNYLIDALLDTPAIKEMYLRRLRTVMDKLLQPASTPYDNRYYESRLDALYAQLMGDPYFKARVGDLKWAFDDIKNKYLATRRQHLYVDHSSNTSYPGYAGIPGAQVGSPTITFGTYDFNPASGTQSQEYIELRNPNGFAVDISGWKLDGGVDFTFQAGTVIPANGSIYVSPDLIAFRSRTTGPRGGQGLLVVGPYKEQLSARGEVVVLKNPSGSTINTLTYSGNPTQGQQSLRITEIMYNPPNGPQANPLGNDQYEFIELQNISNKPLNLSGFKFTQGIDYVFGNTTLAAGQFIVLVRNQPAFELRYGTGINIAGQFQTKSLDNDGDRIQLMDPVGEVVLDFRYEDEWYWSTDQGGRSLVIKDPNASAGSWDTAAGWRPSAKDGGSPGAADPAPETVRPAVNIVDVSPDPRSQPVSSITIVFSERVSGFDLTDLSLVLGQGANLLTVAQTLTTTDGITWTLGNLSALTTAFGTYDLRVRLIGSGITDASGNMLLSGDSETFTVGNVDVTPPTVQISQVLPDPTGPVPSLTIQFSEPVNGFTAADLVLSRDGGANLLESLQTVTSTDKTTFTLQNLDAVTWQVGRYVLTLSAAASGISDDAGNTLAVSASTSFTVDTIQGEADQPGAGLQISLARSVENPALVLVQTAGRPMYTFDPQNLASLKLKGSSGVDRVTIDFSHGSPVPAGGITVDGGNSADYLDVRGGGAADALVVGDHAISRGKTTVRFSAIERLDLAQGTFTMAHDNGLDLSVWGQGTAVFPASWQVPSLSILRDGAVRLAAGGDKVLTTPSLSITENGVLDLADNALVVQSNAATRATTLQAITQWVKQGRNGGDWKGTSITSSAAAADAASLSGLGVVLNDRNDLKSVNGQSVDANSIIVRYTWNGDADLNGVVDADDYFWTDRGLLKQSSGWRDGDYDYSGTIDADDYQLIDRAFLNQSGPLSASQPMQAAIFNTGPKITTDTKKTARKVTKAENKIKVKPKVKAEKGRWWSTDRRR